MRDAEPGSSAGENEGGRQVAPGNRSLHRAKIAHQKPEHIEFAQLPVPELQTMQVLILRERAFLPEAETDFAQ
jgi:hypothetical protein